MKSFLSTISGLLAVAMLAFCPAQAAEAGCQLIKATHSARSKEKAVETSQALALQSAYALQRARGWSHITLSASPVQGDPFWKAVRPNGVPPKAKLAARHSHRSILYDLLYRRGGALRLHNGFKHLRPIAAKSASSAFCHVGSGSDRAGIIAPVDSPLGARPRLGVKRKALFESNVHMSALGHERTIERASGISASPPKSRHDQRRQ